MSIRYDPALQVGAQVFYRCDSCGKEAGYLSDSWSEIAIMTAESIEPVELLHHCLECRSEKVS